MATNEPYYRRALALVHHHGFGHHAEACAPGVLSLLAPVLDRRGLVVELGCGSGLLTRHLVEAGHRVIATDASPEMIRLAREYVPDALEHRVLALPDDLIPSADALVSIGHAISYLPDEPSISGALTAIAAAVEPGGLFALDICDLSWGTARQNQPNLSRVGTDWAIITRFSTPDPTTYVRDMTLFVRDEDDRWVRDDEHHENVLVDTSQLPDRLAGSGLQVVMQRSFGAESLPEGLHVVIGRRPRG